MTGSILSGCVLLGMGSNPAAVRVFRNRPPKDLVQSDRRFPMQGLCRFDPCVFSLAVAVPATRNSILAVLASDVIFLRF